MGPAHWIVAIALGIGLCAAVMGGAWLDLGQSLPGVYNDDWANGVYLHHQVHEALAAGRLDLSDPNQFFPFGYNPVHTNGGNSLEMVVSGLFRIDLGLFVGLRVAPRAPPGLPGALLNGF